MKDQYIVTYTGKKVYFSDPKPESIDISDIAHALSNICRYNGHTKRHYSVLEHSLYVSQSVPKEHALVGLLHDAPEAYLGDVAKPLKNVLGKVYEDLEAKFWKVIAKKYKLPAQIPEIVKEVDKNILANETETLLDGPHIWTGECVKIPGVFIPYRSPAPHLLVSEFLATYIRLQTKSEGV